MGGDAESFFSQIAFARAKQALRSDAAKAFDELFFGRARDLYPRYDFAQMNENEFGALLALD